MTHHTQELKAENNLTDTTVTVENMNTTAKVFGQLVRLGFDVTVFAPAAYRRGSLPRPSKEPSSCGRLRT